jgi:hypothetical protein
MQKFLIFVGFVGFAALYFLRKEKESNNWIWPSYTMTTNHGVTYTIRDGVVTDVKLMN